MAITIPVLARIFVDVIGGIPTQCSTSCPFIQLQPGEEYDYCTLFEVDILATRRCKECMAAESRNEYFEARVPQLFDRM